VAATIVLDQQVRNGRYDTASLAVPDGTQFIEMFSTMSDVDARDASKRCLIAIKVTYDGITWVDNPAWSTEWTGGGTNKSGGPNPPGLGISAEPDAQGRPPARAMITIDTEGFSLNMGVTLKFE
jgi:hypothetical protein